MQLALTVGALMVIKPAVGGSGTPPPVATCVFENQPATQYTWDESCLDPLANTVGCNADSIHKECRFCGMEPYPACPSCTFANEPTTPYVWDSNCGIGGVSRGCFADSVHRECRFCGAEGFDDCPPELKVPSTGTMPTPGRCSFKLEPVTPYVWDAFCGWGNNTKGCYADGLHRQCRFCGFGDYNPCRLRQNQP